MQLVANVTSGNDWDWQSIDWKTVYRIVKNLRQRIFRASREGDLKKVRSLQRLMLRCTSNILEGVRRVTQVNQGKNTPGPDKVLVKTAQEKGALCKKLSNLELHKVHPVKRVYIPKKRGKRPLGIPTIDDRCVQAMVKNALEPYWEARFEGTSYGFRRGRPGRAGDATMRSRRSFVSPGRTKPGNGSWTPTSKAHSTTSNTTLYCERWAIFPLGS